MYVFDGGGWYFGFDFFDCDEGFIAVAREDVDVFRVVLCEFKDSLFS